MASRFPYRQGEGEALSEPETEIDPYAGFGPGLAEWVEYVHEYSEAPWAAKPLMAVLVSSVDNRSGLVRFDRIDRPKLLRAVKGRLALRMTLDEFVEEGFLRREGEGRRVKYFVRGDIARELVDERAGIRRERLRVVPGGKA